MVSKAGPTPADEARQGGGDEKETERIPDPVNGMSNERSTNAATTGRSTPKTYRASGRWSNFNTYSLTPPSRLPRR